LSCLAYSSSSDVSPFAESLSPPSSPPSLPELLSPSFSLLLTEEAVPNFSASAGGVPLALTEFSTVYEPRILKLLT